MRVKGATLEANDSNTTLDTMKMKIQQIVNQLNVPEKPFNLKRAFKKYLLKKG